MTVPEFNPRFTNEDNWACCSVDDNSPWCLAISDCIWDYMGRFYNIKCEIKTCEWPKDNKSDVVYSTYIDNQFYGLKDTDGTCNFAYQNSEYIFIIHIDPVCYNKSYGDKRHSSELFWGGFGCVVSKENPGEIHLVALGEDDGNYWGDHDIGYEILDEFDYGKISEVINEMGFQEKDKIIEKIFELSRTRNLYGQFNF